MNYTRRTILVTGATLFASVPLLKVSPVLASHGNFHWRNYGREPFAQTRTEAKGRLLEVLQTHFHQDLPPEAAHLFIKEVSRRRPRTSRLQKGDRLTAMMSGSIRKPVHRNVHIDFPEGFTAVTDYWEITYQRTRYRLILPLLGQTAGQSDTIETCYNWSLQVKFPRNCFDIPIEAVYRDNRLYDRPVTFTVNIWRPALSATQIDASQCFNSLRVVGCDPHCPPDWDYGGRGKPDLIYEFDVTGQGIFSLPTAAIATAPDRTTEFLICSYREPFAVPSTEAGQGRSYQLDAIRALAPQGGFTWQDAADFRKA